MKIERISATVHSRPADGRREPPVPSTGESVVMTYRKSDGSDLLATLSNGLAVRLAGMQRWSRELQPGDTLRVKVLANDPVLELELEGKSSGRLSSSDSGGASIHRHTAMRLDQAALRQMAWQAPNAASLATSWWMMAQSRWGLGVQREALGDAIAPMAMVGSAPFREPASLLPAPVLDRWLLPVYAWGGMHMALALIEPVEERTSQRRPRRYAAALRLELAPPAIGRIVLLARAEPAGMSLLVAIERSESLPLIREAMHLVLRALTRAGVRPAHVRMIVADESGFGPHRGASPRTQSRFAEQTTSLPLFRLLAETAIVLLQVLPGQLR